MANTLSSLTEDIPLQERVTMFYQHNGAPSDITLQVVETLKLRFPN